jgi:hypothetical protein
MQQQYPVYLRSRMANAVDSLCECGHLHSEHSSVLQPLKGDQTAKIHGEGHCSECSCPRFTWAKWILEPVESNKKKPVGGGLLTL